MKTTVPTVNTDSLVSESFFPKADDMTRIWIHPLFRDVTPGSEEGEWVHARLKEMTEGWTAHEKPVPGNYLIHRNRFVIIANSHPVSGCGIDSSFRVISEVNRSLGGQPSNLVYYLQDDKVMEIPRYRIKSAITDQVINPQTPIINIQLARVKELREGKLELTAAMSFLSDYFPKQT